MDDPAPDPTLLRIGEGIELGQRGERDAARAVFAQTWEDIGGEKGLVWDLRALVAADGLTDERAAEAGVRTSAPAF